MDLQVFDLSFHWKIVSYLYMWPICSRDITIYSIVLVPGQEIHWYKKYKKDFMQLVVKILVYSQSDCQGLHRKLSHRFPKYLDKTNKTKTFKQQNKKHNSYFFLTHCALSVFEFRYRTPTKHTGQEPGQLNRLVPGSNRSHGRFDFRLNIRQWLFQDQRVRHLSWN